MIRRSKQRGISQHPARHLVAEVAALLQALLRKLFGLWRGRLAAIYRCRFHATLRPIPGTWFFQILKSLRRTGRGALAVQNHLAGYATTAHVAFLTGKLEQPESARIVLAYALANMQRRGQIKTTEGIAFIARSSKNPVAAVLCAPAVKP
jgi:hypothetical protein